MLHHVEINVSNLKEARLFWDDLLGRLGYTLYSEWEKGVSWMYGETYLVFVQTEERFFGVWVSSRAYGIEPFGISRGDACGCGCLDGAFSCTGDSNPV